MSYLERSRDCRRNKKPRFLGALTGSHQFAKTLLPRSLLSPKSLIPRSFGLVIDRRNRSIQVFMSVVHWDIPCFYAGLRRACHVCLDYLDAIERQSARHITSALPTRYMPTLFLAKSAWNCSIGTPMSLRPDRAMVSFHSFTMRTCPAWEPNGFVLTGCAGARGAPPSDAGL